MTQTREPYQRRHQRTSAGQTPTGSPAKHKQHTRHRFGKAKIRTASTSLQTQAVAAIEATRRLHWWTPFNGPLANGWHDLGLDWVVRNVYGHHSTLTLSNISHMAVRG